jgi:phospholipase C
MTDPTSPMPSAFSRRRLIQGGAALAASAALAAYLPERVRAAMASTDTNATFDISQVKHVVLCMMENRSFDHYFGTMSGVRGFSDPEAKVLSTGRSVFHQPDPANPDAYLLPYHLDSSTTSAQAVPSISHIWQVQHESWNGGEMDGWLRAHIDSDGHDNGPFTMGYYTSADIPFHYALANAFTICDSYYCSVLGPTRPNRCMWMTGTVDPNGVAGGPQIDDGVFRDLAWTTTAERLEAAGIPWKVYTQTDDDGLNVLKLFSNFWNADPTSPLATKGLGNDTHLDGTPASTAGMAFEEDCAAGTLPTVSWIIPTQAASEHPNSLPAAGAEFIASKIAAIAANEELWNSTVFILDYDENDGFFDHVAPPTPPAGTVDEFVTVKSPNGTYGGNLPVGAGFRVPCIVVSPWTVGGYVSSEPFDHTSILQFVEKVTGITESNITAWRRETFGDMTSVFQGTRAPVPPIPAGAPAATAAELAFQQGQSTLPLPKPPGRTQNVPVQEAGTRPSIG